MSWSPLTSLREQLGALSFPESHPTLFLGMMLGTFVLYKTTVIIYNLFFSPLAEFPGPLLSRATHWPEFFYDVVRPGLYTYEIEKMHDKYGPIVRVTPEELCIRDSLFYEDLYSHSRRMNNDPRFMAGNGYDGSHFLTLDHDLHRARRRVLEPFFSRAGVRRLEGLITKLALHFEARLKECPDQVIRLDHAMACFAGDVIRSITSDGIDLLMDDKDFAPTWSEVFNLVIASVPICTAFPWLIPVCNLIPESWLSVMFPKGQGMVKYKNVARAHIIQAKNDKKAADEKGVNVDDRNSVFRAVINSDMPESELDTERLTKEAQILFGAGTSTTSRTLSLIVYFVFSKPTLRAALAEELREPMAGYPDHFPSQADLEKLPLVHATVKEGLRLGLGVMHSLPHCYPKDTIEYKGWKIPPNTPVGMSILFNHVDKSIFPDPLNFKPERWLGDIDPRMDKAFSPFSKGPRACLGSNLATAELYFIIATFFRPGGIEMSFYETDDSDVRMQHAYMLSLPRMDSKGVRVVVQRD